MTTFPYTLRDPSTPAIGLVVLQVDESIEGDFRAVFRPEDARLYVTRIPSGADLTTDTIADMEHALPAATALLPPAVAFDVVGYACTSATTLIGPGRVHAMLQRAARTRQATDPLTAALSACRALGLERIGIVSPYIASVAAPIRHMFEAAGLMVPDTVSFGEATEAKVARIDPASIADAAVHLGRRDDVDGVFLSCTNLQTFEVLPDLEARLGRPVLSSNQVLAWHMAQLSGTTPHNLPGQLSTTPIRSGTDL